MLTDLWARILSMVDITQPTECWRWTGYLNPRTGYGQITLSQPVQDFLAMPRISTVPRLVCTLVHGPAPEGMVVLHLCHQRDCCAPHHLRWGTQRENNQMAWDGGNQRRGEAHPQAKITDAQVIELRARVAAGETAYAVAKDLGITPSHAYKIVKGQSRAR